MPTNPTIIPNNHRFRILILRPPTTNSRLMRRRENTHIRTYHHPVANLHQRTIQDRQVEIGVESIAQDDVTPVVDTEGRLDVGTLA